MALTGTYDQSGCAGAPRVQIRPGSAGSGWKGNSHAARARRRGGGGPGAGRAGLSGETPAWPCVPVPLLAPGEARRAAPAKGRQPEGSPPPRGGRSWCRLRGSSAPAPPARRLGQVRRPRGQPPTPGAEGDPSGVLGERPRKRPCGTSWGRGFLGQTWGIFPEVVLRGHIPISIRVRGGGGGARGKNWVITSDDLVIQGAGGGGAAMGAWTRRDEASRQADSTPEVVKSKARYRIYATLGGARGATTRPRPPSPAVQAELGSVWALPAAIPRSRDPRAPPLLAPRSCRDTPPDVQRGSPRSRPWGSIGWLATRGRGSGASAPSPAPATQDAASEQRPRGSGPRLGSALRRPGRRGRTGPFRSRPPRHSGVGGGHDREPGFPGQRRPARHPTPAPPRRTRHPLGRAPPPRRAARRGGGARWAGGAAGWGCATADDHFGVCLAIFISSPALLKQLSFVKRKERNLPCVWAPLGLGLQRGHPRAKHGRRT